MFSSSLHWLTAVFLQIFCFSFFTGWPLAEKWGGPRARQVSWTVVARTAALCKIISSPAAGVHLLFCILCFVFLHSKILYFCLLAFCCLFYSFALLSFCLLAFLWLNTKPLAAQHSFTQDYQQRRFHCRLLHHQYVSDLFWKNWQHQKQVIAHPFSKKKYTLVKCSFVYMNLIIFGHTSYVAEKSSGGKNANEGTVAMWNTWSKSITSSLLCLSDEWW